MYFLNNDGRLVVVVTFVLILFKLHMIAMWYLFLYGSMIEDIRYEEQPEEVYESVQVLPYYEFHKVSYIQAQLYHSKVVNMRRYRRDLKF